MMTMKTEPMEQDKTPSVAQSGAQTPTSGQVPSATPSVAGSEADDTMPLASSSRSSSSAGRNKRKSNAGGKGKKRKSKYVSDDEDDDDDFDEYSETG